MKEEQEENPGIHLLVGFQGLTAEEELNGLIRSYHIGGIVLFRRNIQGPDQLKALLAEAQDTARTTLGRPLMVAIDQEGGPVQRLTPPYTQLPSARDLSTQGTDALIRWTEQAARELVDTGIQVNLAPVLDVIPEAGSHFMEARSLGRDPERVARLGRAWIETLQGHGVSATAKHYPGLGQAELDPHHFAPVIRWESPAAMERDLIPFQAAIDAGAHCVMTSHALYPFLDPQWPATLSPTINNLWLRERLGFQGVLLSDDMDMAAVCEKYSREEMVHKGLHSSIDFFLLCQRPENIEPFYRALSTAVRDDKHLRALHRQSLTRIERLFGKHCLAAP